MDLDIRYPIGLMFASFGAILTVFGLISDPAIYAKSLNINVNLWWGIVLFVCGSLFLGFAWSAGAKKKE